MINPFLLLFGTMSLIKTRTIAHLTRLPWDFTQPSASEIDDSSAPYSIANWTPQPWFLALVHHLY